MPRKAAILSAAAVQRPHRNLVPPPQLPADGPIAFLAQPVEVALGVAFREDLDAAVRDGLHGRLGQPVHLDEPLVGQVRLDRRLAAIRVRQIDQPVLDGHHQPLRFQVGDHVLAGHQDGHPLVLAGVGVQRAVGVEDIDHRQVLPLADVVVVRVVRRRDLDAAAAQLGLGPLVRHQRDHAIGQRQEEFSAGQGHVAELFQLRQQRLAALANGVDFLLDVLPFFGRRFGQLVQQSRLGAVQCRRRVGMHGHGRIAQHGLRPRGGDRHVRRFARLRVDHRVLEVPEVALHFLVEYLVVADRRLQERVPVDQPLAAVNQALAEQIEERAADRAGADVVQCEPRPPPIATAAHLLQLAQDAALVLDLPLPDPLDQFFAAQVVTRQILFVLQPPLDNRLRRDSGVVGARHPQGLEALACVSCGSGCPAACCSRRAPGAAPR